MKPLAELTVAARLENLPLLVQSVTKCASENGFGSKLFAIELILEEAFVNICNYSYPESDGNAEVRCMLDEGRFVTEISDSGISFDITSIPDPDTTIDIDGRSAGGLGIFFIKKMTDYVRYERKGTKNVLTLAVGQSDK
jgi:serine/threonine-protein kinase RsbW